MSRREGSDTGQGAAALKPLAEGERPPALLIAIAVCAVLALAVIVGAATAGGLPWPDLEHRGSICADARRQGRDGE